MCSEISSSKAYTIKKNAALKKQVHNFFFSQSYQEILRKYSFKQNASSSNGGNRPRFRN